MDITTGSLLGLIILILDVIVIFSVLTSARSAAYKIGWTLTVLLLPLIGLILYALFGGATFRTATN
jgi:uncharacterized membrane protein